MATPPVLAKVADAVTADLAAGVAASYFETVFEPVRSHGDFDQKLTDDDLHVDVVAVKTPVRCELKDRAPSLAYEIKVDVAVRKRMTASEQEPSTGRAAVEDVDALDYLTQQILEYFVAERLTDYEDAVWDSDNPPEIRTSGPGGTLRALLQYIGIVRLTFRVSRTV